MDDEMLRISALAAKLMRAPRQEKRVPLTKVIALAARDVTEGGPRARAR